jgi:hypothetical protein
MRSVYRVEFDRVTGLRPVYSPTLDRAVLKARELLGEAAEELKEAIENCNANPVVDGDRVKAEIFRHDIPKIGLGSFCTAMTQGGIDEITKHFEFAMEVSVPIDPRPVFALQELAV